MHPSLSNEICIYSPKYVFYSVVSFFLLHKWYESSIIAVLILYISSSINYITPFIHPFSTRCLLTLAVIPTIGRLSPARSRSSVPTCVLHQRSVVYPLVYISFSRYSWIFSLSIPTPIERSPSILIPPLVLPSLAADRFLGSCLLPFPSLAIHPHHSPTISPISLSLSLHALPTTPLRTYANAAAVIGTATRARSATRIFSHENVCVRMGERARAATHTKGTRWASPDHAICARTRAILPSFEPRETVYRSCAMQRELRKGVACCELTRFHASLSKYLSILERD